MSAISAHIEVAFPQQPRQVIPISVLPFFIGRGSENGNHLALDDLRVSRKCLVISAVPEGFRVEDRGQAGGVFVNRDPVTTGRILHDGDQIRLGGDDECQLVFRSPQQTQRPDGQRADGPRTDGLNSLNLAIGTQVSDSHHELNRLSLLLEATSLLHSQLPLESIFGSMLDHAIAITRADRAMLLQPDEAHVLQVKVARGREGKALPPETMNPSRTVIRQAVEQRSAVINEDILLADTSVQTADSVVLQLLRAASAIPLYHLPHGSGSAHTDPSAGGELLGVVYLDSKRASAFSSLDRQILDVLGAQAASILDNARLMQRERERQRLEQELSIARQIQQAIVPQGLTNFPHLDISAIYRPCHEVGGDYYDVFPLPDGRTAIVIADVAGKGLGAALLTTMLRGALSGLTAGSEPVKVFEHLNRFLCERPVVGRYATMFFGLLSPDGILEFIRAGHPSPLLLRCGAISELYHDGSFPIGLLDEATYTATRIQLEPNDTLLLFTDGVTEAEDKNRNLFEVDRLIDTLGLHACGSLDSIEQGIIGAVEKFTHGANQSDDITLLLARYRRPV